MAAKYFRNDLLRDGLTMPDGESHVGFENAVSPIGVSRGDNDQSGVCFFGEAPAKEYRAGAAVFRGPERARTASRSRKILPENRSNLRARGRGVKMIRDLHAAFYGLYAPHWRRAGQGRDGPRGMR